jgi:type IV fimbrial biogenesis protein FimT
MSPAAGFTLLELLIALAIAAVVAAIGVPTLGAYVAEQRLQSRADALLRSLERARSEAVRRGTRVDLCPGTAACAGGALPWEGGWTIFADGARRSPIAAERAAEAGITVRGNRPLADYVSYTAAGRARRFDGALQMGTFTVCAPGFRKRRVIVASSGRARLETASELCP